MSNVNPMFLRYQGPMLATLRDVALASLRSSSSTIPVTPGPIERQSVPPRPAALLDAYNDWCGAKPGRYDNTVPPHLFPQWGFPLASRTIADLPYKLTGVLNQGCRIQINGPIPRNAQLRLNAWLEDVSEIDGKARIHQRLVTSTDEQGELLVADIFAVVLLEKKSGKGNREPEDLSPFTDIGSWNAGINDGRNYGLLSGDLNPIHWIGPYARMAGFKRQILHGFGSFARSFEAIADHHDGKTICDMDVRFLSPLVLPAATRVLSKKQGKSGKSYDVRLIDADARVCMAGSYTLT